MSGGVTHEHEAPLDLLREVPSLPLLLLFRIDVKAPEDAGVEFMSERVTRTRPSEGYVDSVVRITGKDGTGLMLLIEVQRRRDEDKKWTWPVYISDIRRQHKLPVVLMVLCPDAGVAEWAAEPIDLGPSGSIHPHVISPADFPIITDPSTFTGDPDVALLSAMMHAQHPARHDILVATDDIFARLDPAEAWTRARVLGSVLPSDTARAIWREIMSAQTHEYHDLGRAMWEEGREEGLEKGLTAGEARTILLILRSRGLTVTEAVEERVNACADRDQLDSWVKRAVVAETAEDIFT